MTVKRRAIATAVLLTLLFGGVGLASQTTLTTPGSPLTMANLATFLNNAFTTLATNFSGASAPAVCSGGTTCTYQFWVDTTTTPAIFKVYDGAQWVTLFTVNASTHATSVLANNRTAALSVGYTATPNSLGNITNFTVDPTLGNLQYGTNHAAATWTAPVADGTVIVLVTNDGSAGTITFSGFTVGSSTGDTLDTTNGHKFLIQIARINSVSTYIVKALQ